MFSITNLNIGGEKQWRKTLVEKNNSQSVTSSSSSRKFKTFFILLIAAEYRVTFKAIVAAKCVH